MSVNRCQMRLCLVLLAAVQTGGFGLQAASPDTVFFIVRHADRAPQGDALTEAGQRRANALRDILVPLRVSAVYSTDTQRTRDTAAPTAESLDLPIRPYSQLDPAWFQRLRTDHRGRSVLIVGHQPTVEAIVRGLGVRGSFAIGPDEYDNLFIVSVVGDEATVIRLRYGEAMAPQELGMMLEGAAAGNRLAQLAMSESKKWYRFYRVDYKTDESKQFIADSGLDILQDIPGSKSFLVRADESYLQQLRAQGIPADIEIYLRSDLERGSSAARDAFFRGVDMEVNPAGLYHTSDEVKAELGKLAQCSAHARMFSIGKSVLGQDILGN